MITKMMTKEAYDHQDDDKKQGTKEQQKTYQESEQGITKDHQIRISQQKVSADSKEKAQILHAANAKEKEQENGHHGARKYWQITIKRHFANRNCAWQKGGSIADGEPHCSQAKHSKPQSCLCCHAYFEDSNDN